MSGRNWLERDPKNSPGLQRILEAQQAAAAAKAQAEQQTRETAIAARETERRRTEMVERIEQKTAQVLPLLEEIRDFANETGIYPCGGADKYGEKPRLDPNMEVIRKAVITEESFPLEIYHPKKPAKSFKLSYGFRGYVPKYSYESDGSLDGHSGKVFDGWTDAVVWHGIVLQITNSGIAKVLKKEVIHIPYREGWSTGWTSHPDTLAHDETRVVEVLLPEETHLQKDMLSAVFHDPIHLGVVELPPAKYNQDELKTIDNQVNILGAIGALLGIKR